MCGLTGIFCSTYSENIFEKVSKMTSVLSHRGPNDKGIWFDQNIALGHRRLAILDLSVSGSQPMKSECGRYVLVYNGEIYNHLNIRNKLEIEGIAPKWRGHSDTETLLVAIKSWGLDKTLTETHGMFALALWDKKMKTLSLARDRMGEKPLYWGWAGKDFIFGSELKALQAHPNFQKNICSKALLQYLRFMYIPAPRCIYTSIFKLEPGTILLVNGDPPTTESNEPIRPGENYENISIHKYWNYDEEISRGSLNPIKDDSEAVSTTSKILSKAVKGQMISDVPLGAFLSGGIDSSTIVALMQEQSQRPIKTFTIGFEENDLDESSHAAKVAKHLGTDHNEIFITDSEARDVIPNLTWLYDEPFADSSQIPTYLVCQSARQHLTVALSGDGGDEIFGGYNRHIFGPKLWRGLSFLPNNMRKIIAYIIQMFPESAWDRLGGVYNLFRSGSMGISNVGAKTHIFGESLKLIENFDDFYRNMVSVWIEPEKLLKENVTEPVSQLDDIIPNLVMKNSADIMMYQDIRSYLPDDILCKVDRASMGVSLETRAPFLDKDVISLSTRLPINMKIKKGQGKWVLRQVLNKYVPQNLFDRPKSGFAIPIGAWLRGPLRDWAESLLSNERFIEDGTFNIEAINNQWKEHLSGHKDNSKKLWVILMFQAWMIANK